MKVTLNGVFLYSKAVLPFMKERRSGKIVNMGSINDIPSPESSRK